MVVGEAALKELDPPMSKRTGYANSDRESGK